MTSDFDDTVFLSVRNVMKHKFGHLIDVYIKNAKRYINDINEGWQGKNLKAVEDAAHPLKSSSASLGLLKMADVAEEIEILSKTGDISGDKSKKIRGLIKELPEIFIFAENYIAEQSSVQSEKPRNADVTQDKIKVMHIDDDPVICKISKAYLDNAECFDTNTYLDVEEALINSQDFTPDIILVDFMMPDMEGIVSLLNLKADPRLSDVPVVFVTGLDEKEVREKLGDVISGYLQKPYKAEELVSLVRQTCRQYCKETCGK